LLDGQSFAAMYSILLYVLIDRETALYCWRCSFPRVTRHSRSILCCFVVLIEYQQEPAGFTTLKQGAATGTYCQNVLILLRIVEDELLLTYK
jgi:hypothetical protein